MRVAIDCRPFAWTGVGTYLKGAVPAILNLDEQTTYYLLFNEEQEFHHGAKNYEIIRIKALPFSLREQLEIPARLRTISLNIYYATFFNIPLLLPRSIRLITSIYDLALSRFPEQARTKFRKPYYELFIRAVLRRSRKLIVQSEYTKQELVRFFNYHQATRIYPGFDATSPEEVGTLKDLETKFSIQQPYLLYVGVNKLHKNLKTLVHAVADLAKKAEGKDIRLVIAGNKDTFYYDIEEGARVLCVADRVILTDYVNDHDLKTLYHHAFAYVSPAYLESGYSYPVLEAQKARIPVIASELDLEELGGDSVLYFNPYSIDDCRAKIERLLREPRLREELITRGKMNVQRFSVEQCARELIECFKEVANQ